MLCRWRVYLCVPVLMQGAYERAGRKRRAHSKWRAVQRGGQRGVFREGMSSEDFQWFAHCQFRAQIDAQACRTM